jgi:hypothetical protein
MLRLQADCMDGEGTEVAFLFAEWKMDVYILDSVERAE